MSPYRTAWTPWSDGSGNGGHNFRVIVSWTEPDIFFQYLDSVVSPLVLLASEQHFRMSVLNN